MPKFHINLGSVRIALFSFETESINASNGSACPTLKIRYELRAFAFTDTHEDPPTLHPITILQLYGDLSLGQSKVVSRFREDVCFQERQPSSEAYHQGFLEIPLDMFTVERIERGRTGNFMGVLKLRATFALHGAGGDHPAEEFLVSEPVELPLTVPKSQWIEQILPNLGYGQIEIVEVRIPQHLDFGLKNAVKEIREAQAFLPQGDWDNVVSHCRNAIEAIPNSQNLNLPSTTVFRTKVDTFINDCFGPKLGNEECKYLADTMKSLWSLCSRPNHPSPNTFRRAEAEFILRNTMALAEYFGRLLA